MKIKLVIWAILALMAFVFLLTMSRGTYHADPAMRAKEQRARQLARRAKHLNGKQLLGFLSTYAEDEEEMAMALAILQGKDIHAYQQKQTPKRTPDVKKAEDKLPAAPVTQPKEEVPSAQSEPDLPPKPALQPEQKDLQYQFVRVCRFGSVREVEELLAAGVDVNGVDNSATPLLNAVLSDNPQMVELLLEYGATVTPYVLQFAERRQNTEIIELLKSAKAKE